MNYLHETIEYFGQSQQNKVDDDPRGQLATMIVVFYNHAAYAKEAVEAALSQNYSPLEIIFSDDYSTDGTWEIVRDLLTGYAGEHRVLLRVGRKNLGLSRHISRLMELASGELIVIGGGDDVSAPTRVTSIMATAHEKSEAFSFYSDIWVCDKNLNRLSQLRSKTPGPHVTAEQLAIWGETVTGSSHAWRKRLFEIFGPIQGGIFQEDLCIPFRASLLGQVAFMPEILVDYRYHGAGVWSQRVFQKDVSGYRAWHRKWARNCVLINIGFRKDLAIAETKLLCPQLRLAELRILIARGRLEAHAERVLYEWNAFRWLRLISLCALKGTPTRKLAKWFVMRTFLPAYLAYLSRKRRDREA